MANTSCCGKAINSPTLSCSGICQKFFHAKCVALTGPMRDAIMKGGNGLFWYCQECRDQAAALYVSKILKYRELLNGFMNQLKNLESQVASASADISSVSESIPDSLLRNLPNIILSPPTPAADTGSSNYEFPSEQTAQQSTSSTSQTTDGLSPGSSNSDSANDVLNPVGLVVVPPAPRSKVVFLSRLSPDTTEDQLIAHVKLKCAGLTSASKLVCRKLTSKFRPPSDALLSSFKLFVPSELFDKICNSTFWPTGVLVKEFIPRTVRLPVSPEDFPPLPVSQQPPPRTV